MLRCVEKLAGFDGQFFLLKNWGKVGSGGNDQEDNFHPYAQRVLEESDILRHPHASIALCLSFSCCDAEPNGKAMLDTRPIEQLAVCRTKAQTVPAANASAKHSWPPFPSATSLLWKISWFANTTGIGSCRGHGLHGRRAFPDAEFERHGHGHRQCRDVQEGLTKRHESPQVSIYHLSILSILSTNLLSFGVGRNSGGAQGVQSTRCYNQVRQAVQQTYIRLVARSKRPWYSSSVLLAGRRRFKKAGLAHRHRSTSLLPPVCLSTRPRASGGRGKAARWPPGPPPPAP